MKVHSCHKATAVSFPIGLHPTGWHSNTNTPCYPNLITSVMSVEYIAA